MTKVFLGVFVLVAGCLLLSTFRNRNAVSSADTKDAELKAVTAIPDGPPLPRKIVELYSRPLSLHGRVVSAEDGSAISGARVSLSLVVKHDLPPKSKLIETTSDSGGRFELLNERGAAVEIRVSKEGYRRANTPKKRSMVTYSSGPPFGAPYASETSPGRLALLYLQPVPRGLLQSTHSVRKRHRRPAGEETYTFQILDGFEINIRHESGYSRSDSRNGYPWQAEVTFVGGGVTKADDPENFVAPVDGYVSDLVKTVAEMSEGVRWESEYSWRDYFKTDTGAYGIMEWTIKGGSGDLITEFWYSENGNRKIYTDR